MAKGIYVEVGREWNGHGRREGRCLERVDWWTCEIGDE